jgi:penicillin amidase
MIRWLKRLAPLLLALVLLAAGTAWWLLRGSLPQLDGRQRLAGLAGAVTIERDALGTATVEAGNRFDAARALGFVHAQERYFEMDLMRRNAAGELSALFGARALNADRKLRVHRLRMRAGRSLASLPAEGRRLLQAYADGANAGLAALDRKPWPYLLLRQDPQPWTPTDSMLVGFAMYLDLQDERNADEAALARIRPHLPPALFRLLLHDGSRWDAPIAGRTRGDAVLPGPDEVDLRRLPAPREPLAAGASAAPLPMGSNNFAVAGALTADGRAILADDMHLSLRAPNIWFRARLRYADPSASEGRVDAGGVTLPGLPAIVVGSNGRVAWGFTNSYIDTADWALVVACGDHPGEDCMPVRETRETIAVAGADPVKLVVRETDWGPLLEEGIDGAGHALALRWNAHLPGALNLGLAGFMAAADLDQALAAADRTAIPTQNLLLADRSGRIAWRLLGPLPMRAPVCRSDAPQPLSECPPWPLSTSDSPVIVDPPSGRLWTANTRVVDGAALARLGDGGYVGGARGRQIRDALFTRQRFDERDLLAIQLDHRALFLAPWWKLLQERADASATPALADLARAASRWEGSANPDAVGYRLVRGWREAVLDRIADGLTAPARAALDADFVMPDLPQLEGVAWPLVTQRPPHLLPRRYDTWDALFEDAAIEVRDALRKRGPLAERSWGERNTARICHPLAAALPLLGERLLCMARDAIPGDWNMPRAASPDYGASERMVVAPGREEDGILHMPGGQSGHPLSPYWGAGHDDWVQGRPTPFLPGKAQHKLRLTP